MRHLAWLGALAVIFQVSPVQAQVEARAGLGFASGTVGGAEVERGYGVSLNVQFEVLPLLSLYGAYTRYTFGAEVPGGRVALGTVEPGDRDADVVDVGYAVGAQFTPPLFGSVLPWVRAGVLYDEVDLKLKREGGSTTFSTDGDIGMEAAAGLSFPFSPLLAITPGVLYRRMTPEFRLEADESDLSYWAIEIGISYNR